MENELNTKLLELQNDKKKVIMLMEKCDVNDNEKIKKLNDLYIEILYRIFNLLEKD